MEITVYCSGSIQKGVSDSGKLCWTDVEREAVAKGAAPAIVRFLNPDDPIRDPGDVEASFGRDLYQVQFADAVLVDGRERRGIGIGIEMLASRILGSALVAIVPRNTYYRMDSVTYRGATVSDYVHPHVAALADAVVSTFEEAGAWLRQHHHELNAAKSSIDRMYQGIRAYEERLLPHDEPMLKLMNEIGDGRESVDASGR
jgi:hypothetical protein